MKLYKFSSLASLQRVSESLALSLRSLPSIGDMASPSTWRTNHFQEKEITLPPLPSTKAIDCSSIWKTTTQKHWNCIFISVALSNQIDRSWKIHLFSYAMHWHICHIWHWQIYSNSFFRFLHSTSVQVWVWWMIEIEGNTSKDSSWYFHDKTLMKIEFPLIQLCQERPFLTCQVPNY